MPIFFFNELSLLTGVVRRSAQWTEEDVLSREFSFQNNLLSATLPPLKLGEFLMSKVCQVTKRKPRKGRTYAIRGIAKKKKGIGLNITGKTKRRFEPNLMKKRLWFAEENRFISLRLTPAAMRTIDKQGLATVVRKLRAEGQKV